MALVPINSKPSCCSFCKLIEREGRREVLFARLQRRSLPSGPLIKPDTRGLLMLKEAVNSGIHFKALEYNKTQNCIELILASMAQRLDLLPKQAFQMFTSESSDLREMILFGLPRDEGSKGEKERGKSFFKLRRWLKTLLQTGEKDKLGNFLVRENWGVRPVLSLFQHCLVSCCSTVATQAAVLLTKLVLCCLKSSSGGNMARLLMEWIKSREVLRTMVAGMQLHSSTSTPLCFTISYVFVGHYKVLLHELLPKACLSKSAMISCMHGILSSRAFQHRKIKVETIRSRALPLVIKVALEQLESDLKGETRRWSAFASEPLEQCTCGAAAFNALALLHHIWMAYPSETTPLSSRIISSFLLATRAASSPIAISAVSCLIAMLHQSIVSASDTLTEPLQQAVISCLTRFVKQGSRRTAAALAHMAMAGVIRKDVYRNLEVNDSVRRLVDSLPCRAATEEETLLFAALATHKGLRVKAALLLADTMAKCVLIPTEAPQLLQPQGDLLCSLLCSQAFGKHPLIVAYRLRCVRLATTMVVKLECEIRAKLRNRSRVELADAGYNTRYRTYQHGNDWLEREAKQTALYQQTVVVWVMKRLITYQCSSFPPEACEETAQLWDSLHEANTT